MHQVSTVQQIFALVRTSEAMLRSAANPPPVDTMHCQMYLSNGSGGRINGTAMIGGTLLHGGIMNGTLVHGRMKDEG